MKCPNCGEELEEGSLYCKKCGEDIHIVPDFEPELESNLERNISGILEELKEQSDRERAADSTAKGSVYIRNQRSEKGKKFLRYAWLFLASVFVIVVVASASLGVWLYLYNSREYQVKQAEKYTAAGSYEKAVSCYNRALELSGGDIELRFSLAEVQLLRNNKVEYEYLLREIAGDKNASAEQLDRAYGRLITIYKDRGDYRTINELLLACENEQVLSAYQNYIARTPEFSIPGGTYEGIQPLKLTVFGAGKIYYTLDGSDPDAESSQYIAPIILEDGRYVVKALFINDNGIYSDIASAEYFIDNEEIPAPQISVESGDYGAPIYIEVLEDDEDVYYTTDGKDPSYASSVYKAPIPMPLGNSVFRFAKIVDGVVGEVAEKVYRLELNTEYTPEEAEGDILNYYLINGMVLDETGRINDQGDRYIFLYQYVANINDSGDFYVISELIETEEGDLTRTGTDYAVDIYTREFYKLLQDEYDGFVLVGLETINDSLTGE